MQIGSLLPYYSVSPQENRLALYYGNAQRNALIDKKALNRPFTL